MLSEEPLGMFYKFINSIKIFIDATTLTNVHKKVLPTTTTTAFLRLLLLPLQCCF